MTKLSKRVLALTVSVILSSTALLGGCGSVEGDYEDTAGEKKTIKENISTVFSSASNAGETITSALSGETDTAYSAELTVDFGKALTKDAGMDLDTITISSDSKIKNGNAQTVIKGKYGKDTLATADIVRDKETGNIYIGIPELSPAYMMVTGDFVEQQANGLLDQIEGSVDISTDLTVGGEQLMSTDNLPEISEEDLDKMFDTYYNIVIGSFSEPVANGTVSGDIDDVEYKFDKKTLTVTNQEIADMLNKLAETAKNDEIILDLIEQYGAAEGVTVEDFQASIDQALGEMQNAEVQDASADIDLYYQDDEISGFAMTMDGMKVEMFCYMTDSELCAAVNMTNSAEEAQDMKMTLSAETDGYMTDLTAKLDMGEEGYMTFEVEDFKVVDEETGAFKGTMRYSMKADEMSASVEFVSKSTAKKTDFEITMDVDGENMMTVTFVGEETKATDVTIPSGQVYDISDEAQMEAYGATVDAEGFTKRLQEILGDDLGAMGSMGGMGSMEDYEDMMGDYEDMMGDYEDYEDMLGDTDLITF